MNRIQMDVTPLRNFIAQTEAMAQRLSEKMVTCTWCF